MKEMARMTPPPLGSREREKRKGTSVLHQQSPIVLGRLTWSRIVYLVHIIDTAKDMNRKRNKLNKKIDTKQAGRMTPSTKR
jgi:hypothetical protein